MNEPALKYDLEFSMVHQELLDKCWDECEKILKRSVKRSNGRVTIDDIYSCLLYTSPSPRDRTRSRMPSSA